MQLLDVGKTLLKNYNKRAMEIVASAEIAKPKAHGQKNLLRKECIPPFIDLLILYQIDSLTHMLPILKVFLHFLIKMCCFCYS